MPKIAKKRLCKQGLDINQEKQAPGAKKKATENKCKENNYRQDLLKEKKD